MNIKCQALIRNFSKKSFRDKSFHPSVYCRMMKMLQMFLKTDPDQIQPCQFLNVSRNFVYKLQSLVKQGFMSSHQRNLGVVRA